VTILELVGDGPPACWSRTKWACARSPSKLSTSPTREWIVEHGKQAELFTNPQQAGRKLSRPDL